MRCKPQISIIIPTYNWPEALAFSLWSLNHQHDGGFEVIVADDGSNQATTTMISQLKQSVHYPLTHVWQPDEGRQAAKIRNKAAAKAQHPYWVFIDGDCFVMPDFVKRHRRLAEQGFFVPGQRVLLKPDYTQAILKQGYSAEMTRMGYWLKQRVSGHCNRWLPLLGLPFAPFRKSAPYQWQGAKTCNLGLWAQDFRRVNGFDERYMGWGYEDSDLVVRLIKSGVKRKSGRLAAPVLHLWHPVSSMAQEQQNWQQLAAVMAAHDFQAQQGIDQYLNQRG